MPFIDIGASEPSFTVFPSTLSARTSLASTLRVWQGPAHRVARVAMDSSTSAWVCFGTSAIVISNSGTGMRVLPGETEFFSLGPSDTFISYATLSTSTSININVTPGYWTP
jgi:hypothetical protein